MKKNNNKTTNTLKNNIYAFCVIWKCAPRRVIFDVIKNIYLPIYFFFEHIYVYKFVMDSIQYKRPFIYVVFYMIALFVGQMILNRGEDVYGTYFREKDEQKIIEGLQFNIYDKATKIDLINYDRKEFFDDFVWNVNDVKSRFLDTYRNVILILDGVMNAVVYGTFILSADYFGIFLVTGVFIAQYFISTKANKIYYKLNMDMRPGIRRRDYIKRVFYMQDFANELKMNSIHQKFYDMNKNAADEIIEIRKKASVKLVIINFINNFIFNTLVFDVVYILYLAYKALVLKLISYGTIISLIRSMWNFEGAISRITNAIPQLHQNSLYIDKYKEFLSFASNIKNGKDRLENEKIEKIELKNISFAYDEKTSVLKKINMEINKNEKIAIVGYNGAGKTTLANIILRLYEKDSGEILINGRQVETIELESYKKRFSAVFQDFYLYAANVMENIALDVTSDENRLREAVKLSGLEEKIASLEKGMETNLTKEFDESGVNLSGGETQKIALARAVYHIGDIIIMDEPSSALDPIAEFNLNQTIIDIARDRIVFFISHRLSTTKIADRIFYIENGEIAESGSHNELMELNGKYAEMFNIQAQKYSKN